MKDKPTELDREAAGLLVEGLTFLALESRRRMELVRILLRSLESWPDAFGVLVALSPELATLATYDARKALDVVELHLAHLELEQHHRTVPTEDERDSWRKRAEWLRADHAAKEAAVRR